MLNKNDQTINGIVLINKSPGYTSNKLLQKVKHLYQAKKAGHTGSLDPLATGMLPICFGEATKFSQYLLDANKFYCARGRLGTKTDTGDCTGQVIAEKNNFQVNLASLSAVLSSFKGETKQVPSMYSALKHQGVPLYKLARQGRQVEREARTINILNLNLLSFDDNEFVIEVECSKGTYIRNLIEDIGEQLGVFAHMTALHRVYTSGFNQENMYSLEELSDLSIEERYAKILPIERAIPNFAAVTLSGEEIQALRYGQTIPFNHHDSQLRLYDEKNNFIGLGEVDEQAILRVKRLIAFNV